MIFLRTMLLAALLSGAFEVSYAHTESSGVMKAGSLNKQQLEWGIAGDAKRVTRTIAVQMLDTMRFVPDSIRVTKGETVKFVVRNDGKIPHEMVIGTKKAVDEHAASMMKHPGMEHEEPYSVTVAAGKGEGIVWNFNRVGEFDFACLIPGHYQAGMAGKVRVSVAGGK